MRYDDQPQGFPLSTTMTTLCLLPGHDVPASIMGVPPCVFLGLSTYSRGPALTTRYYTGVSSHCVPLRLVDEISERNAMSRGGYYRGTFDTGGRLVVAEKWLDGDLSFRHEYSFEPEEGRSARPTS